MTVTEKGDRERRWVGRRGGGGGGRTNPVSVGERGSDAEMRRYKKEER